MIFHGRGIGDELRTLFMTGFSFSLSFVWFGFVVIIVPYRIVCLS